MTMPITAAQFLNKRTNASVIIEANRVACEAGRITAVNSAIHRWCLAEEIKESDITQRHADHACYFCGANAKSAGIIVHSFGQCPEHFTVHDKVEERLRELAQKAGVKIKRKRSQHASNERNDPRRENTGYDETSQNQLFPRRDRGQGEQRWGSCDPSMERGNRNNPARYDEPRPDNRIGNDRRGDEGRRDRNDPIRYDNHRPDNRN